mmetsp:Transcript_41913/g.122636  ORF Transcript_41913/g.122636 Transcript_41913/m.122636 type:complete len:158 (-) Transcript_41913:250-723(-)
MHPISRRLLWQDCPGWVIMGCPARVSGDVPTPERPELETLQTNSQPGHPPITSRACLDARDPSKPSVSDEHGLDAAFPCASRNLIVLKATPSLQTHSRSRQDPVHKMRVFHAQLLKSKRSGGDVPEVHRTQLRHQCVVHDLSDRLAHACKRHDVKRA